MLRGGRQAGLSHSECFAGEMVSSRPLCKELGLVAGRHRPRCGLHGGQAEAPTVSIYVSKSQVRGIEV